MNYNDFEKHIGKTLAASTPTVDEQALFEGLGIAEPKKTPWIPVLAVVVCSLLIASFIYLFAQNDDARPSKKTTHKQLVSPTPTSEYIDETKNVQTDDYESESKLTEAIHSEDANNLSMDTTPSTDREERQDPRTSTKNAIASTQNLTIFNKQDPSYTKATPLTPTNSNKNTDIVKHRALMPPISDLARLDQQLQKSIDLVSKGKVECPSFKDKLWTIGWGIEGGLGKTISNITVQDDYTEGMGYRLENEKALESIYLRGYASIERKDIPVGINVGLAYRRMAHQLRLQDEKVSQDTTVGIINTIVSASGDTITHIYGDIITTTRLKIDRTRHYYVHELSIPLSVYYNFSMQNIMIQPEIGCNVNVYTRGEGNILQSDKTFAKIRETNYLDTKIGLGFFGQVNIHYPLSDRMSVYIAPSFSYDPTSIANSIDHKTSFAEIKVGLKRYL